MTHLYLQSFQQLLSRGDVGHVDGGAEGMKHLHFLKDIFAAGGPNDEKLAALVTERRMCYCADKKASEKTGGSLNEMSSVRNIS